MRQRQSREDAPHESHFVPALQLRFPNPQHAPAERAGDEAVADAVGGDLLPPEGGIGFRRRGVDRAAVPKAAVDEDGEAVRPENKVGFHAEGLQLQAFSFPLERSSSPPAGDAAGANDCDQPKLRGAVGARTDQTGRASSNREAGIACFNSQVMATGRSPWISIILLAGPRKMNGAVSSSRRFSNLAKNKTV